MVGKPVVEVGDEQLPPAPQGATQDHVKPVMGGSCQCLHELRPHAYLLYCSSSTLAAAAASSSAMILQAKVPLSDHNTCS